MLSRIGLVVLTFSFTSCVTHNQQSIKSKAKEPTSPSIFHIAAQANHGQDSAQRSDFRLTAFEGLQLPDSLDLMVLSLADSVMYNDFENHIQKFAQDQKSKYLLLAVAEKDSMQKARFMTYFFQNMLKVKDKEVSHAKALDQIKMEYDTLDFKSVLLKKN